MDEHDEVLRSLAALDRQPAPDPRFVMRLGDELMPARTHAMFTNEGAITSQAPRLRGATAGQRVSQSPRTWARSPFLSAAVMLTVIAIVGLTVVIGGRDKGGGHTGMLAVASPAEAQATPPTSQCPVAPRELAEVTQIVRWVVEGIPADAEFATPSATADASLSGSVLPAGEPASPEITNEVNTIYQTLHACWNEGNYLSAFALYTDDGIARTLAPNGVANVDAIALLSNAPSSGQKQYSLKPFTRVEQLPDGRVVGYQPDSYNPEGYVIFKHVDGRWMIDEVFESHG